MLGGRAIGTIIGIISGCGLFVLLVACCIVYYRRHLRQKAPTYVTAAQADDERTNEQTRTEHAPANRTTNYTTSDSPPPYEEAVRLRVD